MQERERERVLILGPEEAARLLAGRVALFHYRGLRAVGEEQAREALAAAPTPIHVGLLILAHPLPDLAGALRRLSGAVLAGGLHWIGVGPHPDAALAVDLRLAGVRFALREPYGDEDLRFVLNEARHAADPARLRGESRVPASLEARVATAAGQKVAVVHNLSVAGAYLATPRPSQRGACLRVRFDLPDLSAIDTGAQVMWHNVPGNLRRSNAPIGMGVRFLELSGVLQQALRRFIDERSRAYRL